MIPNKKLVKSFAYNFIFKIRFNKTSVIPRCFHAFLRYLFDFLSFFRIILSTAGQTHLK
jgi:hypothetical protein